MLLASRHAHEIPDTDSLTFDDGAAVHHHCRLHLRVGVDRDFGTRRKTQHFDQQAAATVVYERLGLASVLTGLPWQLRLLDQAVVLLAGEFLDLVMVIAALKRAE